MGNNTSDASPLVGGANLFVLALAATVLFGLGAWLVGGQTALIGIDDAAITRNYAENLANGHGFVYYVDGERVEGATSFLWTVILSIAYLATPAPEMLILAISSFFTALGVFAALSVALLIARCLGLSQRVVLSLTLLGFLGLPGYFFWSIISMMEVAVWSATLMLLIWRVAKLVERPKQWDIWLVCAAATLPLIRPEGIAIALGLLALAALLMMRMPRGLIAAALGAVFAATAVTLFRLWYFGFPAPNTFYAKVSSDRLQDAVDGAKYLFSFISGHPFAELLVGFWAIAAVWALFQLLGGAKIGARALLIGAASVFGIFAIYGALGGDHFAYWRFLQPIFPMFAVGLALAGAAAWPLLFQHARKPTAISVATVAALIWGSVTFGDYRQNRFLLKRETKLVELGLAFGDLMNEIDPDAVMGVSAAGGIALSYDGPLLDLLGLNWVEMAHAVPVKTGLRNHASFDKPTFWRHQPDFISEFNRTCTKDAFIVRRVFEGITKGLYADDRFQASYVPIRIFDDDICWRGFGRADWVARQTDQRIETVAWNDVELRP